MFSRGEGPPTAVAIVPTQVRCPPALVRGPLRLTPIFTTFFFLFGDLVSIVSYFGDVYFSGLDFNGV